MVTDRDHRRTVGYYAGRCQGGWATGRLELFPYEDVPHTEIVLPERVYNSDYERATLPQELYVPGKY